MKLGLMSHPIPKFSARFITLRKVIFFFFKFWLCWHTSLVAHGM